MDEQSDRDDGFGWGMGMFRAWPEMAAKMMRAGMAFSPEDTPPEAARQMRSTLLKAWGDYYQQAMRSPEFLGLIRNMLNGGIDWQKQWNDFFTRIQHEFQGASRQGIDRVMQSVEQVERRLVDSLERVSDQLDNVTTRLADLERRMDDRDDGAGRGRKKDRGKTRKDD